MEAYSFVRIRHQTQKEPTWLLCKAAAAESRRLGNFLLYLQYLCVDRTLWQSEVERKLKKLVARLPLGVCVCVLSSH